MKSLVTGANGFVGANLVRALLREGGQVRAFVRAESDRASLAGLDVEVVTGSFDDPGSLDRALAGCDELYHVAALYRLWPPDPPPFQSANVVGTRAVMAAALRARTPRVVHTSTVGAVGSAPRGGSATEDAVWDLGEDGDPYVISKHAAEAEVLRLCGEGLPAVVVNPAAPIGPWDRKPTPTGQLVLDLLRGRMPAWLLATMNVVDVEDVARGHILAARRGAVGRRYILGGVNVTMRAFTRMVAEVGGVRAPLVPLPNLLARAVAHWQAWRASRPGGAAPQITPAFARMAGRRIAFDDARARAELGWAPGPIRPAVERAAVWFRANGYLDR